MRKIIKAEDLPEHANVYLKEDIFGWRVVHPVRNDDRTINWNNLLIGGLGNFLKTGVFLGIILVLLFSYSHDVQEIKDFYGTIANDPIAYCKNLCVEGKVIEEINVSNWNLTREVNPN